MLYHQSGFLKQTWKCVIWLLQLQLVLIFGIFFFPFLIFYGFMEFKTRKGKMIITFNWRNMRVKTVALKHFLQHSYHFQGILCTYYLSSWANAGFAVRKLCDCEIETEVVIRLRTGVLFHRMMSVSILFTFLEEEHGKSVSNSSLFYT